MPNRLADEISPYLLQHKDNPVDWYPWGSEAHQRAMQENKPIFLSIGYSACHWCHVMEHESFENERIAALLNEHFISIKVDREERPDLDQIYMNAVQVLTGRGGRSMSVFLTPQLEPFYGGTYWPAESRMGMPGFDQVLSSVWDAWQNRNAQAREQAGKLTAYLQQLGKPAVSDRAPDIELLQHAEAALERVFDFSYGGFGGAPKVPHPMDLRLLLRMWQRNGRAGLLEMVQLNLDKMAGGGIYDHLGGGFHRYSVDQQWLVPHFEKMLYDNALLSQAYLDAYLATGSVAYEAVVRETLDYVIREMQHPEGGFYSTQDADSEGVEGKFFVWTPEEVRAVLGGDAAADTFCRVYDVTDTGNFEGQNILNLPKSITACAKLLDRDEPQLRNELSAAREKLFAARAARVAPGLDDKVLVSWNGLMIQSMAQAAGVLDEPRYLAAATQAASFIWQHMRRDDGRLYHTWRNGQARLAGYLDDYASLADAMVTLYEATFDERWLDRAAELADVMLECFHDGEQGGFFYTATDHESLIVRQKDVSDNAVPSGSALAATALLRLGKLSGRADYLDAAVGTLQAAAAAMQEMPMAMGQMLLALDLYLGASYEIVVLGDAGQGDTADVLRRLRQRYLPRRVLSCRASAAAAEGSPLLNDLYAGKQRRGAEPTLFVCENFACREPTEGKDAALTAIDQLARSGQ